MRSADILRNNIDVAEYKLFVLGYFHLVLMTA